jgi:hypothetical protein
MPGSTTELPAAPSPSADVGCRKVQPSTKQPLGNLHGSCSVCPSCTCKQHNATPALVGHSKSMLGPGRQKNKPCPSTAVVVVIETLDLPRRIVARHGLRGRPSFSIWLSETKPNTQAERIDVVPSPSPERTDSTDPPPLFVAFRRKERRGPMSSVSSLSVVSFSVPDSCYGQRLASSRTSAICFVVRSSLGDAAPALTSRESKQTTRDTGPYG